ncbi:C-type lectin domain family 4 member G-like [Anoplopoma fimbria]|uniref:C-type lectin domain family 4 member G-like n=1 Tax=Anoplopoma fimbria TaxID=229290 RepID=UPI0023EC695C|nr:C-type lectin domain family 4 member G-like [Anoplopoma fimbria]
MTNSISQHTAIGGRDRVKERNLCYQDVEGINEEDDYVNTPVPTVDKEAAAPDQRFLSFTRSLPPIAVCWLILLVIMGLRIYFTSVIYENDGKLMEENQNLTTQNKKLENLNQELEMKRNNLTEQIQNMEMNCNKLNVSIAQWIDAYCHKNYNVKQSEPCQDGWSLTEPSCYAVNDAPNDELTWEEAREDCRGKISDLVVVHTEQEKVVINGYSWTGGNGYWIGLRVEDGKWKWIDGTELNQSSWIEAPTEGHCAFSVHSQGWKSAMCNEKKQWICEKEALSV